MVHFISTFSLFRFSLLPNLYISQVFSVAVGAMSKLSATQVMFSDSQGNSIVFMGITWKIYYKNPYQNEMNSTGPGYK